MEYEITETIMKHFNDNYLGKPYTLENKKNFELYITNLIIDKFLKGQVMVLYNNIFLSEDIKILDILEFLPYSNFVKWTGIYNVYQNYELVGIAEYFGKMTISIKQQVQSVLEQLQNSDLERKVINI